MRSTPIRQQDANAVGPAWPPPQGEWTYEDWCKLPDDGYRYEVITGVLYVSPPPSIRHQRISVDTHGLTPVALAKEVCIYLEGCMPSNSL